MGRGFIMVRSSLRQQILAALVLFLTLWSWSGSVSAQQPAPEKARSCFNGEEVVLVKALESQMAFCIKCQLRDILDFLEEKTRHDLRFRSDATEFKDKAFDEQDVLGGFVSKNIVKKIKVRTILNMILSERRLGYYIEDGLVV